VSLADVAFIVLAVELVERGSRIPSLHQFSQRVFGKDVVDVGEKDLVGLGVDYADVTGSRLVPWNILFHSNEIDVEIVTFEVNEGRGAVVHQYEVDHRHQISVIPLVAFE